MKLGPVIQKIAVARFTRTMATLVGSGVPILQSIEITGKTSGNTVIEEAMVDVKESVRSGESIAKPLSRATVFPPMVTHMISIGEETGALDSMLNKVADFYENRGRRHRQVADLDHRADHDDVRRRHRRRHRHLDVPADVQHDEPGAIRVSWH